MTKERRARNARSPAQSRPMDPRRRRALLGIAGCAAGALSARDAVAQAAACLLTQDAGEGPFYFDPSLLRADITDGADGAPLDIAIRVNGASDCSALAAVRVDLWQADGVGLYSGYRDQQGVGGISTAPAVGQTYLRGTQLTDDEGLVRFRTIYPSWYGGRTPHLHFKVFVGDEEVIASQLFFPDEVNAEVFSGWDPYREHVAKRRVFNRNDPLIDAGGDGRTDGAFCAIERFDSTGIGAAAAVTVRDA